MIKKVKRLIPDAIKSKIRSLFKEKKKDGWFGDYSTWEAAEKDCEGYQSGTILEKVKESVLKVKTGKAIYERDSVLFNEIQYSKPLIDAFEKSIEQNCLHIVDFGGSLGSSYFQHKSVFKYVNDLKWAVVEQKHFVECGKREIAENGLQFYFTVEEGLKNQNAHVLLLSSVVQYFAKPYDLIESLLKHNFEYIIVDRTAFIESDKERITKQIVPTFIYNASYPSWFLNEAKFVKAFEKEYTLINVFDSAFDDVEYLEDGSKVYRKGFYFKLNK